MAALKASELKYGVPLKIAVGDMFLTATRVELPTAKEYEVGSLELNLEKLGLTVGAPAGVVTAALAQGLAPEAGETATTTALPALIWCSPFAVAAKTDAESAKEVTEGYLAAVSVVGTKAILRFFGVTTAGDGKPINEVKTATKVTFTAAQAVTVYALGK